jgi:hypothetical protein
VVAVVCLTYPPFLALLIAGQTSAFGLAWCCAGYLALRAGRPVAAGLVLGMLVYKPTLAIVTAYLIVAQRDVRLLIGAAGAVCIQALAVAGYFGLEAIVAYSRNVGVVLSSVSLLEARPEIMHSFRSFFAQLVPWPDAALALYALASAVTTVFAVRLWRTAAHLELRYAGVLLAATLVNPHVYTYELVVAAAAYLLLAAWAVSNRVTDRGFWVIGYASVILPLVDPLLTHTGVQWTVVALTLLFAAVVRYSTRAPAGSHPVT